MLAVIVTAAFVDVAGGILSRIIPCYRLVILVAILGGRRTRNKRHQVVEDLLKQVLFAVQEFL